MSHVCTIFPRQQHQQAPMRTVRGFNNHLLARLSHIRPAGSCSYMGGIALLQCSTTVYYSPLCKCSLSQLAAIWLKIHLQDILQSASFAQSIDSRDGLLLLQRAYVAEINRNYVLPYCSIQLRAHLLLDSHAARDEGADLIDPHILRSRCSLRDMNEMLQKKPTEHGILHSYKMLRSTEPGLQPFGEQIGMPCTLSSTNWSAAPNTVHSLIPSFIPITDPSSFTLSRDINKQPFPSLRRSCRLTSTKLFIARCSKGMVTPCPGWFSRQNFFFATFSTRIFFFTFHFVL